MNICIACMAEKAPGLPCTKCNWRASDAPEAPHHLPPRTVLNDTYLLGRVLSEDEFGIGYVAMELRSRQKLMIKEFFPRSLAGRRPGSTQLVYGNTTLQDFFNFGLGQFIEEGMALQNARQFAGLQRTNDLIRENGTAYRVMDYVDGPTLENYLAMRPEPLAFQDILKITFPLMNALIHLHNTGLLHYDIHPGNIIVQRNGTGVLVNFCSANFAIAQRESNLSSILRPGYSPPELYIKDDAFSPQSDIYSIAATIYRAMTGHRPPNALTRLEEDTLERLVTFDPHLAPRAEAGLIKALSVRPAGRFQKIVEFRNAILTPPQKKPNRQAKPAVDAFTAIICPVCATNNEILKTDLQSGNSQCRACSHPFILDSRQRLAQPPTFKQRGGNGSEAQQVPPTPVDPAKPFSFTIVQCRNCRLDNEVLVNDLAAGVLCFNCASVLSDSIEYVGPVDRKQIPGQPPPTGAGKKITAPPPLSSQARASADTAVKAPPAPLRQTPQAAPTPGSAGRNGKSHHSAPPVKQTEQQTPPRPLRPTIPPPPPPPATEVDIPALEDLQARLTCPACATVNPVPIDQLMNRARCKNCGKILLDTVPVDEPEDMEESSASAEPKHKGGLLDELELLAPDLPDSNIEDDPDSSIIIFDGDELQVEPEAPTRNFTPYQEPQLPAGKTGADDISTGEFLDYSDSFKKDKTENSNPDIPTFQGPDIEVEPEAPTQEFVRPKSKLPGRRPLLPPPEPEAKSEESRFEFDESTLFNLSDDLEEKSNKIDTTAQKTLEDRIKKPLKPPKPVDMRPLESLSDLSDPSIDMQDDQVSEEDIFPSTQYTEGDPLDNSGLTVLTCDNCGRGNSYHPDNLEDNLRCRYCKHPFGPMQGDMSVSLSPEQVDELLNLSAKKQERDPTMTMVTCPNCKTRNLMPTSVLRNGGDCNRCGKVIIQSDKDGEAILGEQKAETAAIAAAVYRGAGSVSKKIWLAAGMIVFLLAAAIAGIGYWKQSQSKALQQQLNVHLQQADTDLAEQNYAGAVSEYEAALQIVPENETIKRRLANSLLLLETERQQRFSSERLQTFLQQLRRDADSLYQEKQYEESLVKYEMLIKDFPEDSSLFGRINEINRLLSQATARPKTGKTSIEKPRVVQQNSERRLDIRSGTDLAESIERATPGSVLVLGAGIHQISKPVLVNKSITITGAGLDKTLLVSSHAGNIIEVRNGASFTISGVSLEHQGSAAANIIYVENGQLTISGCLLKGATDEFGSTAAGAALFFAGDAKGKVSGNSIISNLTGIRLSKNSNPQISDNSIRNNKVGLEISENATSSVSNNVIKENVGDGVVISGASRPLLEGNKILQNRKNGVTIDNSKYGGTLRGNQIDENRESGVLIGGASVPSLEENMVRSNGNRGIYYRGNAKGVARNNEVHRNKYGGITLANNSGPTVRDNTIRENDGDGIELMNKSKALVNRNKVFSNQGNGISVALQQNGGILTNNECIGNLGYGISYATEFRPTSDFGHTTNGNHEGHIYEEDAEK